MKALIFVLVFICAYFLSLALATPLCRLYGSYLRRIEMKLDKVNMRVNAKLIAIILLFFSLFIGWGGVYIFKHPVGCCLGLVLFPIFSCFFIFFEKRKNRLFETQLVDALFISANSLKAGFSLLQAFEMVVREMSSPLKDEFERVVQDVRLGLSMNEALGKMQDRLNSEEMDLMVTAIEIHFQMGGNVAELFETIAHVIKERMYFQGQLKAMTAQGRLTGAVILALPVGLWSVVRTLDPEYFAPLYGTPLGITMLVMAAVMEAIGLVMIKKICSIDF